MKNEMNILKLVIKAKHLAVEPKIIRDTVQHLDGKSRETFRNHHVTVIRPESRATQLAIAYMLGKPYKSVERKRKPCKAYEFDKVKERVLIMLRKYHDRNTTIEDVTAWTTFGE